MRRPVRIVILATNLLVIIMCVRFAIFVIWFAQYKDRMVGPSVTYAFYALLAVVVAQAMNIVCWWMVRKKPVERRFLRRVALCTLACVFTCFWLAERFRYSGDPDAPGRRAMSIQGDESFSMAGRLTHTAVLPPSARTGPAAPGSGPSSSRSIRTTGS
jgi:hypothetical protein